MALVAWAGTDKLAIQDLALKIKNNRSAQIVISKGETINITDEVSGAKVPLVSATKMVLEPGDMAFLIIEQ